MTEPAKADDLVRADGESVTEFTIRRIRAEIESPLVAELEKLRAQLAEAEALARQYSDSLAKTADDRTAWSKRALAAESSLARARKALDVIAPAVESLACHQVQCDEHGVMVQVSRQAVDEVVNSINQLAIDLTRAALQPDGEKA